MHGMLIHQSVENRSFHTSQVMVSYCFTVVCTKVVFDMLKIGTIACLCVAITVPLMAMRSLDAKTAAIGTHIRRSIAADFMRWGQSTVELSLRDFFRGHGRLLATRVRFVSPHHWVAARTPATAWDQGLFILMLAAGAEHRAADAQLLRRYLPQLMWYWRVAHGVGGFNAEPGHGPLDRYYDDNEWITWGLLRGYRATHDSVFLKAAESDFQFVLSGRSRQLGGGIFWHEQDKNYKNTCANAPAVIDALQLFQITHRRRYRRIALAIYRWINTHLQAPDHLFYDGERINHTINKMEWSYNTGAMLTANCLLYRATHRRTYLIRAQSIAHSARLKWISTATGGVHDGGPFAWVLLNGFLHLYRADNQARWLRMVIKAMLYVHGRCRDQDGLYGNRWDRAVRSDSPRSLLDQAAAGGAFFQAANAINVYLRRHN